MNQEGTKNMSRINVYEDNELEGPQLVGWFDPEKAQRYVEGTRWDGNNHIGLCSGIEARFGGEALHRTAGGRWVLHHDASSYFNGPDTWRFVTDGQAREWLIRSEYDSARVEEITGSQVEDERGPGRPEIGPAVKVRIPEQLLAQVDAAAEAEGVTRAAWLRGAVEATLS